MFYAMRSRILYGFKHFGRVSAIALFANTLVIEPLVRLVVAVTSLRWSTVGDTVKGYSLLYRDIPGILRAVRDSKAGRNP